MTSRNPIWQIALVLVFAPVLASEEDGLTLRRPVLGTAGQRIKESTRRRNPLHSHLLLTLTKLDHPTVAELRRHGLRPVSYKPPADLVVVAPDSASLEGLPILNAAPLSAEHKLSVLLKEEGHFVADFYPDVSPGDMRSIALECGLEILQHPDLLERQLLVSGTRSQVAELANWDEVSYVFPASPELAAGLPVAACAGAHTEFGMVAQYVMRAGDGWDGPGLGPALLDWVVTRWTERLPRDTQRAEIERAFTEWARYVQLTFSPAGQARGAKTIELQFARGDHGDGYPFDGPGHVLAHTFYPAPPNPEPLAGDIHLDDDEAWTAGGNLDLYTVVLHELGHALGLGHSDQPGAVMYPYYRRAQSLTDEDIRAVRQMYATRVETPATPSDTPSTPSTTPATPPTTPATPPTTPATPPTTPATPPTTPAAPGTPTTPGDNAAPVLAIVSPATSNVLTSASTIRVRGTARDSDGIAAVTWTAMAGRNGTAEGTESWLAAAIPLLTGSNRIVIQARDNAGKTSWKSVTVTRR